MMGSKTLLLALAFTAFILMVSCRPYDEQFINNFHPDMEVEICRIDLARGMKYEEPIGCTNESDSVGQYIVTINSLTFDGDNITLTIKKLQSSSPDSVPSSTANAHCGYKYSVVEICSINIPSRTQSAKDDLPCMKGSDHLAEYSLYLSNSFTGHDILITIKEQVRYTSC